MQEIFKKIPDFPNHRVSNHGRVQSRYKRGIGLTESWHDMKPNRHKGYLCITVRDKGKSRTTRVHRLVAEAFLENPQGMEQVDHIDCDKSNNKVSNLEWVTARENTRRAFKNNLVRRKGVNNSGAKLNDIKVLVIKTLMLSGWRNRDLMGYAGVKNNTLSTLRAGKSWTHICGDL